MGTKQGIVLWILLFPGIPLLAGQASAEPSYLVYPSSPAVFRYDPARYDLLISNDPRYNGDFALSGEMLWDRVQYRVPVEIYRAPALIGFEPSATGGSEYVTVANEFDVIVDGFSSSPRTLGGLCLRFWPEPNHVGAQLSIDGQPLSRLLAPIPSVEVLTPIDGGYFSDAAVHRVSWIGASAVRIIAFSDKDGNGSFDGAPLYTVVARDVVVGVESTTWGGIKALYRD